MSYHRLFTATLAFALSGFSVSALAHPGDAAHFINGMLHPFSGLDHLLAAIAAGIWVIVTLRRLSCILARLPGLAWIKAWA